MASFPGLAESFHDLCRAENALLIAGSCRFGVTRNSGRGKRGEAKAGMRYIADGVPAGREPAIGVGTTADGNIAKYSAG